MGNAPTLFLSDVDHLLGYGRHYEHRRDTIHGVPAHGPAHWLSRDCWCGPDAYRVGEAEFTYLHHRGVH